MVELSRKEKCAGCGRCAFNRRDKIRVTAIKDAACTAGDRVVVTLPEKEIVLAPLFLFVLPVLFMLAGIALSRRCRCPRRSPSSPPPSAADLRSRLRPTGYIGKSAGICR